MVAVALFCFAPCLLGQTVNMALTSAGSNVMDGVYVGPYSATVNGVSTQVICIDYADDSYIGESWKATVSTFSSLIGKQTSSTSSTILTQQDYNAITWLVAQMLNPKNTQIQVGEYQFAIWGVLDPAAIASLSSWNSADGSQAETYLQEALEQGSPSGGPFTAYIPSPDNPPQTFISDPLSVPETTPAVIILGFNLLALVAGALFLRRYTRFRFSTD
jgi:hypothetical protein